MPDLASRLNAIRQLPLHQFMGLQQLEASDGQATLLATAGDNAMNPGGMLHGGVVYTLADVSAYAAVLSVVGEDQEAVTHDLHVSVFRPGNRGDQLRCEAQVVKQGRTLAFVDVRLHCGDKLLATVRVTKSIIDQR